MESFPELLTLNVPEELIETLEENQVAVQNYLSSNSILFFFMTLDERQERLKQVSKVITIWLNVQSH